MKALGHAIAHNGFVLFVGILIITQDLLWPHGDDKKLAIVIAIVLVMLVIGTLVHHANPNKDGEQDYIV